MFFLCVALTVTIYTHLTMVYTGRLATIKVGWGVVTVNFFIIFRQNFNDLQSLQIGFPDILFLVYPI